MNRSAILQILSLVLLIAGVGILFYLYPPNFKQILIVGAVVLILIGFFLGIGGVVTSVGKPEKGTIMK